MLSTANSHVFVCSGNVWRIDASVDKTIMIMLQGRDIHVKDLLDMVREVDIFDLDAITGLARDG
jgi:hypothetical protein